MNRFSNLFYYIGNNYYLNITSEFLVRNILNYVELQGFVNDEECIDALSCLLGDAIFDMGVALSKEEIKAQVIPK